MGRGIKRPANKNRRALKLRVEIRLLCCALIYIYIACLTPRTAHALQLPQTQWLLKESQSFDLHCIRQLKAHYRGISCAHGRSLWQERRVALRAQALVLAARFPALGAHRRATERAGRAAGESSSSSVPGSPTPRVCVLLLSGLHDGHPADLLRVSEPDEPELRGGDPGAGRRVTVMRGVSGPPDTVNKHNLYWSTFTLNMLITLLN